MKNTDADTEVKKATRGLVENQINSSAQDIKQKAMTNTIIQKTLDAQIKKANAEGNYAEINQLMGILNSGVNSGAAIKDMFIPSLKAPPVKGKK